MRRSEEDRFTDFVRETPLELVNRRAWGGGVDLDRIGDIAEHERVWTAVLSLPSRQLAVTVLAARRLADLLGEPAVQSAPSAKVAMS